MSSSNMDDHERFIDETLPEGAVVDGETLTRDVTEELDFIVVGSGAAGAVAANTLARGGFSVGIVEEGPWVKTREFTEDVYTAFKRMFRDRGTQVLEGHAYMPLIQGRCVGGSTVMNSAIAHRTPEDVIDDWRARFGSRLTMKELDAHFEALEEELNVHAVTDEALGNNSAMFLEEGNRMGMEPQRMRRYEKGCKGTGRCFTGCPRAAKQGMNVSYVPWTLSLGARIYCQVKVEKVIVENGRAAGIEGIGTTLDPARKDLKKVRLRARRGVVIAASTIQSPNILRRSGIKSRHLGEHFQAHPGVGMGGLFDEPVSMHVGATQGAESIHYRRTERLKFETIAMQPELAAVRIPGIGAELMKRFGDFSHLGVWCVLVRSEAEGTVKPGWGGHDKVNFNLTKPDMQQLRKGAAMLARMFFDAGAREVWPGIYGVPSVIKSMDEVRLIEESSPDARNYSFVATHLFGAARMGPDPSMSVVNLDFETHECKDLYVVDSSVFPTNLGVNPQHSIMALSRLAATRILEKQVPAAARSGVKLGEEPQVHSRA